MWGTEYSGPESAVKNAFENKAVVICNAEESDADALNWVKAMYKKIGMHILEMDAAAHDLHAPMSAIFHISLLLHWRIQVLEKEKRRPGHF
jgi:prephenate dehydrogenase